MRKTVTRHPVMTVHLSRVEVIGRRSGNVSHSSHVVPIAVAHALRHLGVVVDSVQLMRLVLLVLLRMMVMMIVWMLALVLVGDRSCRASGGRFRCC